MADGKDQRADRDRCRDAEPLPQRSVEKSPEKELLGHRGEKASAQQRDKEAGPRHLAAQEQIDAALHPLQPTPKPLLRHHADGPSQRQKDERDAGGRQKPLPAPPGRRDPQLGPGKLARPHGQQKGPPGEKDKVEGVCHEGDQQRSLAQDPALDGQPHGQACGKKGPDDQQRVKHELDAAKRGRFLFGGRPPAFFVHGRSFPAEYTTSCS